MNDIDVPRLRRLRLDGYRLGAQICFCPRCDFQYDPGELGPMHCPLCGKKMYGAKVTEDLIALQK